MSTKPQERPAPNEAPHEAPHAARDSAETLPGTYEAAEAEVDDDRDTLRAPPRQDETPVVLPNLNAPAFRSSVGQVAAPPIGVPAPARVGPPPLPLARLALMKRMREAVGQPPPLPPALPAAPALPTAPEPSLDGDTARAPGLELEAADTDDIPTLQADAMDEAERAAHEASAAAAGARPQLNSRDVYIPPLPVPKDLPKLLELERGGVESVRAASGASANEPSRPISTLSPAERAARTRAPKHEARGGRRRLLGGLWIAAAGVAAIGASTLWQPVAEPIVPRRSAALAPPAASEAVAPSSAPEAVLAPAPAPAAPAASAVATAETAPVPLPARAATAPTAPTSATPREPAPVEGALPPRPRAVPRAFASVRLRKSSAPAIDPASLPESPSRKAVIDAMSPLREEITRCSAGRGGVAEIMLTVDASGAVRHASLVGDYSGTAQGSCIALAARKAHFAPFRQDRFSVRYPMTL